MAKLLKTVEEQERWLAEGQYEEKAAPSVVDPRYPGYGGTLHFADWMMYHAVGFASGRYTLGIADLAAAKFGKSTATKDLHDRILSHGLKINDVSVPGESLWQVEDVKGNVAFVNPDKEIEGTYAKDLGQVYASFTGLEVTSDMQAAYDVARFVGSVSPVGKAVGVVTKTAKINPRALRILQTGITGLTTDTLLQVEDTLSEKRDEFSPSQALKTGGVFVLFGGVVEGISATKIAIADAYRLRQYFKSAQGIEALKSVPKADLKYFISAKKAVAEGMPQARWNRRYSEQRLGNIWRKMAKAYEKTHPTPSTVRLLPEKVGLNVSVATPTKAVTSALVQTSKTNPYYQMPLATIKDDAAQGVALAKQALARFAPDVPLSKEAISPMTQHQLGQIEGMVDRHELTPEAVDRLLNYSTGESDISSLTIEQAEVFKEHLSNFDVLVEDTNVVSEVAPVAIDINLPKGSMARLRKLAGSDEVLNKVMLYNNRLGGAPSNAAIPNLAARQKSYAQDLEDAARVIRRHERKIKAAAAKGREVNALSVWSSARYAIGQAELKSGTPLRRLFSNIVAEGVDVPNQTASAIEQAIKNAGVSRIGSPNTFKEGKQITSWLFEEDEAIKQEIWEGMSEKVRALTANAQELMQGPSARNIRAARFVKWDSAAKKAQEKLNHVQIAGKKLSKNALEKIMEPVRKAKPINAPAIALTEGRAAKEIGQFDEWLDTQTWGTRKFYYMSEREFNDLVNLYPTGAIPEELEQQLTVLGKMPEVSLPATMTREGHAKMAKGGSIWAAIANHMNRAGVFAATHDDLTKFWEAFASTNPSINDINSVRALINNVLGFHHALDVPTKIVRGASRYFWTPYFAFSPKRSIFFAGRNLHQNMAYGLSQTSMKEVIKSGAEMATGELNPWMKDDYEKFWISRISQRKQMYHQFLMQKQGSIINEFGNKAGAILDTMASAPVYSDEVNRLIAWPVLHQTAYRNVEKFANGKISYGKLMSNLDIDTLHTTQRIELKRLLDKGKVREFVANLAEYKVENIHGRYETALRSIAEQAPGGRAWLGLMTFPRLTFELLYQNGWKPFVQGFESGNYKQSYKGLKAILMTMFGSRVARWSLYTITGKKAYDLFDTIFRYTPVAPGAARIRDMFDEVSNILYYADENDKDIPETADAIMGAVSHQFELFIPFCDVALDYYETTEDVYGVRLYSLLKKKALQQYKNETGRKFRDADRDYHERIQHMFWGGAEKGKEAKKRKRKAPVLKDIFGGGKSLYD